MDPWYKHAIPRREVREGRSFSPDEFAIASNTWSLVPPPTITPTRNNSSRAPGFTRALARSDTGRKYLDVS
jgi:hypothetical protein